MQRLVVGLIFLLASQFANASSAKCSNALDQLASPAKRLQKLIDSGATGQEIADSAEELSTNVLKAKSVCSGSFLTNLAIGKNQCHSNIDYYVDAIKSLQSYIDNNTNELIPVQTQLVSTIDHATRSSCN